MTKIITIVGGSGSWKWYLAKEIAKAFGEENVSILPHDMYYYPADTFPKELEFEFYGNSFKNFDCPDALETELLIEHIIALKSGQEVQIPEYDFGNNDEKKGKRHPGKIIKPTEYIIIDGIFSLTNKHIRKLTDVAIYIDVDTTNQMARRFMRDWWKWQTRSDMWHPGMWDDILFYIHHVQKGFKDYVEPSRKKADLVVSNNEWVEDGEVPRMVDVAVNYLKGKFS